MGIPASTPAHARSDVCVLTPPSSRFVLLRGGNGCQHPWAFLPVCARCMLCFFFFFFLQGGGGGRGCMRRAWLHGGCFRWVCSMYAHPADATCRVNIQRDRRGMRPTRAWRAPCVCVCASCMHAHIWRCLARVRGSGREEEGHTFTPPLPLSFSQYVSIIIMLPPRCCTSAANMGAATVCA